MQQNKNDRGNKKKTTPVALIRNREKNQRKPDVKETHTRDYGTRPKERPKE